MQCCLKATKNFFFPFLSSNVLPIEEAKKVLFDMSITIGVIFYPKQLQNTMQYPLMSI